MNAERRRGDSPRLPVDPEMCRWANMKCRIQARPAYLRINTTLRDHAPCSGFGHEVLVLIWFNSTGDQGLPIDEDDLSAVDEIEDRFKEGLESDGTAILAMVKTHDGVRGLYFYSCDPNAAIERWEKKLRIRSHRVEFHVRPDPLWVPYQDYAFLEP